MSIRYLGFVVSLCYCRLRSQGRTWKILGFLNNIELTLRSLCNLELVWAVWVCTAVVAVHRALAWLQIRNYVSITNAQRPEVQEHWQSYYL